MLHASAVTLSEYDYHGKRGLSDLDVLVTIQMLKDS